MKKLITTLLLTSTLVLSTQIVSADDHRSKMRHSPEDIVDRMAERLNLTHEQQQNIQLVIEQEREKMNALRIERKEKIASYLTDEQQQQFENMRPRGKRCERGRDRDDD